MRTTRVEVHVRAWGRESVSVAVDLCGAPCGIHGLRFRWVAYLRDCSCNCVVGQLDERSGTLAVRRDVPLRIVLQIWQRERLAGAAARELVYVGEVLPAPPPVTPDPPAAPAPPASSP